MQPTDQRKHDEIVREWRKDEYGFGPVRGGQGHTASDVEQSGLVIAYVVAAWLVITAGALLWMIVK